MQPNIELNIEQLTLHGFSSRDAFYIGRAVERRLTYLIRERGVPKHFSSGLEMPRIDAGNFNFSRGMNATGVGTAIAGRVYAGIKMKV